MIFYKKCSVYPHGVTPWPTFWLYHWLVKNSYYRYRFSPFVLPYWFVWKIRLKWMSPFWFVHAVWTACRRFDLFKMDVAVMVCRRFSLSLFWLSPFDSFEMDVAVMVGYCRRLGLSPFQPSAVAVLTVAVSIGSFKMDVAVMICRRFGLSPFLLYSEK